MPHHVEINIALAIDKNYLEPVETLIKSICCWHKKVNFYLLHSGDIPVEWISELQHKLLAFSSTLASLTVDPLNVQLSSRAFAREVPITHSTFHRYFIPNLISAERVLYLDSDIVINGSLLPLFTMPMQDFPIGAIFDIGLTPTEHNYTLNNPDNIIRYKGEGLRPYLNAGVLLINAPRCRELEATQRLILTTLNYGSALKYSDQDALNLVFYQDWIELGVKYNYQVGARGKDTECQNGDSSLYPIPEAPVIIHYTGGKKPWLEEFRNNTSYHQLYWEYKNLRWEDIKPNN